MSLYFLLSTSIVAVHVQASEYAERQDVIAFANDFAKNHKANAADILKILADGKKQTSIIAAISRPAEKALTWGQYRKIFIEKERIDKGVIFWKDNWKVLEDVSQRYQVAPEIIVAIIGVETRYGRVAGNYRVLDALLTLGFDYQPRAPFFRGQLEEFLLMCQEQKLNPLTLMGSYAGAMGYGQFIPSSYRNYAVDYDQDGIADIWKNPADAIASVGNYFAEHQWRLSRPVAIQIPATNINAALISPSLEVDKTIGQLRAAKLTIPEDLSDDTKVTLMRQEVEGGVEYWLGFENFYTITRYNHSSMYALAAFQLSEILKASLNNL